MGPHDSATALGWIQDAVAAGRYIVHPHLDRRCRERDVSLWEVKGAIGRATRCSPYDGREPTADGTNWRVFGTLKDGSELTVGVEAFVDHLGRRTLLITVF